MVLGRSKAASSNWGRLFLTCRQRYYCALCYRRNALAVQISGIQVASREQTCHQRHSEAVPLIIERSPCGDPALKLVPFVAHSCASNGSSSIPAELGATSARIDIHVARGDRRQLRTTTQSVASVLPVVRRLLAHPLSRTVRILPGPDVLDTSNVFESR